MEQLQIELTIPADIGATVVSRSATRLLLTENAMTVVSTGAESPAALAHHDFGATALAIAGTAVGAAAIKGLFGVVNTLVKEVFATYRQRQKLQHERRLLTLKIGAETHAIDLDREFIEVEAQVAALEARWTAEPV